jgi:hypothetical protein
VNASRGVCHEGGKNGPLEGKWTEYEAEEEKPRMGI